MCSDRDLSDRQAPSLSEHAISPQTEACFSTTHGFNWRLLLLLPCLQLRKEKKIYKNLIMKSETGQQIKLAEPVNCRYLRVFAKLTEEEKAA